MSPSVSQSAAPTLKSTMLEGLRKATALSLCVALASQGTAVQSKALHSGLELRQEDPCVDPEAIWATIRPGTANNLSWTPCYTTSNFTQLCSKLAVPLDYAQPQGESAVIALVKVPAAVNSTDARYRGPILFNPGGPGESGIDFIVQNGLGAMYQQIIGDEFDIIGFDPRGVSRTQPLVNVFPDVIENLGWHVPSLLSPLFNTTPDAVPRMRASAQTFSSVAGARINNTGPYVGTAQVARDMLSITRAFGREKVQYWGFSYGTTLGQTFAAMFPDKVERMIIDGVIDPDDYYTMSWKKNLFDADKELLRILQECVDIGPDVCALHEQTAEEVHTRLTKILDNLKTTPVSVPTRGGAGDYGILEYKIVKRTLFTFLNSPYVDTGRSLMAAFRALEDGDGRPFWDFVSPPASPSTSPSNCTLTPSAPPFQEADAETAIACSDGLPVNDTAKQLEEYFEELRAQSEFADVWAIRPTCIGWPFRPVERFAGPFVANTSFPLLLIGNTDDPAAPLVNAHDMSKNFNGSVVLTQDSGGHTSSAATSTCIAKAVRDYFRDGVLPKEGTVCEIAESVFNGTNAQNDLVSRDSEERAFVETWSGLRKGFRLPGRNWHKRRA